MKNRLQADLPRQARLPQHVRAHQVTQLQSEFSRRPGGIECEKKRFSPALPRQRRPPEPGSSFGDSCDQTVEKEGDPFFGETFGAHDFSEKKNRHSPFLCFRVGAGLGSVVRRGRGENRKGHKDDVAVEVPGAQYGRTLLEEVGIEIRKRAFRLRGFVRCGHGVRFLEDVQKTVAPLTRELLPVSSEYVGSYGKKEVQFVSFLEKDFAEDDVGSGFNLDVADFLPESGKRPLQFGPEFFFPSNVFALSK